MKNSHLIKHEIKKEVKGIFKNLQKFIKNSKKRSVAVAAVVRTKLGLVENSFEHRFGMQIVEKIVLIHYSNASKIYFLIYQPL